VLKSVVIILALSVLAQNLACSTTPVGVRRVSPSEVHRTLTASVLSTGQPSSASTQVLDRLDLFTLHREDPEAALVALRAEMLATSERTDLLFALAELEFYRGEQLRRDEARPHFLSAAYYALACMTHLLSGEMKSALDPRFRVAADLYNRGLTSGLITDDGEFVDLTPRTLTLSFGSLELEADEGDRIWGGYRMTDFVPVAELHVRGLRNRYRRPGVGVPLAASLERVSDAERIPGEDHISRNVRVAATALVLFDGGMSQLEGDVVEGGLRLFTLDETTRVPVGDQSVALEYEPTAALAFALAEERPWSFERSGFLSGDFGEDVDRGLRMLAPYDRDRIPVVFVHGTASSPARWAEMINHLRSDSAILAGYQFWIFQYNTGNPIPFSAGLLRESVVDLVAELDPEGDDENLKRMVLVGHSQGGLLAKLCVVDGGDEFWRGISTAPIDELELEPETRRVLERSLFFDRLPFVERVVFIATPHRGSFLADRWLSRFASGFVSMPGELVDAAGDLFDETDDRILLQSLDDMPSSLDNMASDNQFLRALVEVPISPDVHAHSIIAVLDGQDDLDSGHDGVVAVESARLEGVDSELIVRSGHSTQSHPVSMREVRRILLEGLR
jgi:pimeloyl-ACP methyl ester carboxylesterase